MDFVNGINSRIQIDEIFEYFIMPVRRRQKRVYPSMGNDIRPAVHQQFNRIRMTTCRG